VVFSRARRDRTSPASVCPLAAAWSNACVCLQDDPLRCRSPWLAAATGSTRNVAKVLGVNKQQGHASSRRTAVSTFAIRRTREEEAVAIYYRNLIQLRDGEPLASLRARARTCRTFPEPIDIVCSGGTSHGQVASPRSSKTSSAKIDFPIPIRNGSSTPSERAHLAWPRAASWRPRSATDTTHAPASD
jgi:hypothetical protein